MAQRELEWYLDPVGANESAKRLSQNCGSKQVTLVLFERAFGIAKVKEESKDKFQYGFLLLVSWSAVKSVQPLTNSAKKGVLRVNLLGKEYFDFSALDDLSASEVINLIKKTKESFHEEEKRKLTESKKMRIAQKDSK